MGETLKREMEREFEFITIPQPTSMYSSRKNKTDGVRVPFFNASSQYPLHPSEPFLYFLCPLSHFKLLYALYMQGFYSFCLGAFFSHSQWAFTSPTFLRRIYPQFTPSLSSCFRTFSHLLNVVLHRVFSVLLYFISAERKE
jgi:hypothetical protein